jgi:hypothetical protein
LALIASIDRDHAMPRVQHARAPHNLDPDASGGFCHNFGHARQWQGERHGQ